MNRDGAWGISLGDGKLSGGFAALEPLLLAAGGLSLSQVCAVTGVESSTVQNWVKRGWVAKPKEKKYGERQLARILLLSALREGMQLERIVRLLARINGSVEDREDDMIPESRLYDCLCFVMERCFQTGELGEESVDACVEESLASYEGAKENKERLRESLRVMVFACAAARFRKLCDQGFLGLFSQVDNAFEV